MTEALPCARVLRALSSDHHIRFTVLDAGPLWDGVRRGHPHLEAEACACLVELVSAALLLQSRTFFTERLQLMLRGSGIASALIVDSWPEGDIRGVLDTAPGEQEGPWIQGPGFLKVMRSNPKGQPYIGTLELVEGAIQVQIEAYLLHSEQTRASVTLWCDAATGTAGALFVEPMPDCPRERLKSLVEAIEGLAVVPDWERTPEFLCRWINQGEGTEILSTTEIHYRCRCRKDALMDILRGFAADKLEELFQGEGPAEMRCEYCGKAYLIHRSELPTRGKGVHAEA
jgi:molecular chaperone Hsp33